MQRPIVCSMHVCWVNGAIDLRWMWCVWSSTVRAAKYLLKILLVGAILELANFAMMPFRATPWPFVQEPDLPCASWLKMYA